MSERAAVPMIHVPDVRATVAFYERLGFVVQSTHEDEGQLDWASLRYGSSEVMFNAGGATSTAERRDVDLYVRVDDVARVFERVRGLAELVEDLHDTFYGRREFIVRDPNRFWITFGQALP